MARSLTAGKINRQGMNLPSFVPKGQVRVYPEIDASDPLSKLEVMENRCSQTGLMTFLRTVVSPWMSDRIVERFAYEGDATVGGPWAPLAQYTVRLKRQLGGSLDTNERSGDMLFHLAYEHAVEPWIEGALLRIPDDSDNIMEKKLRVAQFGQAPGENALFPNSVTPPRPVLGIGEIEEAAISRMFNTYMFGGI